MLFNCCIICSDVPYLCCGNLFLLFVFDQSDKRLITFTFIYLFQVYHFYYLLQEPTFAFIDFFYCLTIFCFIDFYSSLLFPFFAYFGLHLLFCFLFKVKPEVTDIKLLFFSNIVLQCYKFPSNLIVSHKF